MAIQYAWHADDRYYATVVDSYYRQLPWLLHLRSQAILMWIVLSGFALSSDMDFRGKWIFTAIVTALAFAYATLVKRGIMLKYRLRPSFGAETTFRISDNEVVITGTGAGQFPWTVYERAVHYSDGILLLRKGGMRWLPNAALKEGTVGDAIAIVRAHLPVRDLA